MSHDRDYLVQGNNFNSKAYFMSRGNCHNNNIVYDHMVLVVSALFCQTNAVSYVDRNCVDVFTRTRSVTTRSDLIQSCVVFISSFINSFLYWLIIIFKIVIFYHKFLFQNLITRSARSQIALVCAYLYCYKIGWFFFFFDIIMYIPILIF